MTMVWEKLDMSSYCQVSFWYDVHSIELCDLAGERQWLNKLVLSVTDNDGLRKRDLWDIDAVADNFHSIGLCERRWLGETSLSVTDTMLWSQDCKFHFLSLQNKTPFFFFFLSLCSFQKVEQFVNLGPTPTPTFLSAPVNMEDLFKRLWQGTPMQVDNSSSYQPRS